MLYSLLAFLLGMLLDVSAQTIHQWPAVKVQAVGSPLSLECTVKGTSNPNLYWYWQAPGGTLQQLFYSFNVGQSELVVQRNLSASRPKSEQFILSTEKLLLTHSGFYLCAWSLTLSGVGQTSVQKPHPLFSATSLARNPH
uniref:Ig-like domain-containing protein n=2 Tax=Rattus norvegicus TaxID=10116 RepID=A0ABK0LT42_RAT